MDTAYITDQERFVKFLELLPEEFFDNFLNDELWNARYHLKSFSRVSREFEISRRALAKFKDDAVNTKFTAFNETLSSLQGFLIANFFPIGPAGSGYYALNDNLAKTGNTDDEAMWYRLKEELDSLCDTAEVAYGDFIQTTNEILSVRVPEEHEAPHSPHTERTPNEITIGPLSYKNELLYHDDSVIKGLSPQVIKIGALFMRTPNEFISYKTIQDEATAITHTTKENMQKLVSILRRTLNTLTAKNLLKNYPTKGYMFESNKIL